MRPYENRYINSEMAERDNHNKKFSFRHPYIPLQNLKKKLTYLDVNYAEAEGNINLIQTYLPDVMSVKLEPGEIPYYKEYIPAFNLEQYAIQYYRSYNASKIIYYDKLKKELEELNDRLNKLMIEEKVQKEKLKRFDGLIYRADVLRSRYDHLLKLFRPDIYDRVRFDKPTAKLFIRSDRKKKQTKNLNYTTKPHQDVFEPPKIDKKQPKKLIVDEVNNINFLAEDKEEVVEEEEYELFPPSPPQTPPPRMRVDQCGGNDEIEDYDYDTKKEEELRATEKSSIEKEKYNNNEIIDEVSGEEEKEVENEVDNNFTYPKPQHEEQPQYIDDEVDDENIKESFKESFKDSFVNESKFERSDSK